MHTGPSDGVLIQSCPGSPDSSLQAIHIGFTLRAHDVLQLIPDKEVQRGAVRRIGWPVLLADEVDELASQPVLCGV